MTAWLGIIILGAPTSGFSNMLDYGSLDCISFEKPLAGVFEGWSFVPVPNLEGCTPLGTISLIPAESRPGGGNCVEFKFIKPGQIHMGLWKKIEISPATKYLASIWTKSTGMPIQMELEFSFVTIPQEDGKRNMRVVSSRFETTKEWRKSESEIESHANEELLHIRIHATNRSKDHQTLWIDEISLDSN